MGSHSHDTGKGRFGKLVSGATESLPRLPLVHTTDAYGLSDVLSAGAISPQPCDVFIGESLSYFFYGRPSYRPNLKEEPTSLSHYYPVCLIFDPSWSEVAKRIFPFDTGAYANGFYDQFLHRRMKLADFSLEADHATPGRVVSMFFGSVRNYLLGAAEAPLSVDASEFEAASYQSLVQDRNSNAVDNRSSGIEVQFDRVISLHDAVRAVVLPAPFLDGAIGRSLATMNVEALPYKLLPRTRPNEYISQLTELTFSYYQQIGIVPAGSL